MSRRGKQRRESALEPRAYLREIQNILPGLQTRTKIIKAMKDTLKPARKISDETGLSYKVVNHHLQLMANENTVLRKGKRPRRWQLTGLGQQRIA